MKIKYEVSRKQNQLAPQRYHLIGVFEYPYNKTSSVTVLVAYIYDDISNIVRRVPIKETYE